MNLRSQNKSQLVNKMSVSLRDFYSAKDFDSDNDSDESDDSNGSPSNKYDRTARDLDAKSNLTKGQR